MKNQNYLSSQNFGSGGGFETDLHLAYSTGRYFDPNSIEDSNIFDGVSEQQVDFDEFFAQNLSDEEDV